MNNLGSTLRTFCANYFKVFVKIAQAFGPCRTLVTCIECITFIIVLDCVQYLKRQNVNYYIKIFYKEQFILVCLCARDAKMSPSAAALFSVNHAQYNNTLQTHCTQFICKSVYTGTQKNKEK